MYLPPDHYSILRTGSIIPALQVATLHEKGSGSINEDVLLVKHDELFGVFDGATSLDSRRFNGNETGGYLAAHLAAETFEQSDKDLFTTAIRANERIRIAQEEANIPADDRHLLWSTSMAVARIQGNTLEYCQTGDSLIMLLHQDGGWSLPVQENDFDQETLHVLKARINGEVTDDEVSAQIRKVRLLMNKSYGVLNGEPEAVNFLLHGCIELNGVSDVLIFTDGLFLPKENPCSAHDWEQFSHLYRNGGLQEVCEYVRALQKSDKTMSKYPRFKRHDDIAAIAIALNAVVQPDFRSQPAVATSL